MADSSAVHIGVCNITFNGEDMGYTSGGCSVSFSAETQDITADQESSPIGKIITSQSCSVTVPLTEWNLERFASLLPGATLTTDGTDSTLMKLELSGEAGGNLLDSAAELVLTPVDADENQVITMYYAVPTPNLEFSFEKDNQRVYEITFDAMKGENGFVVFGYATATA